MLFIIFSIWEMLVEGFCVCWSRHSFSLELLIVSSRKNLLWNILAGDLGSFHQTSFTSVLLSYIYVQALWRLNVCPTWHLLRNEILYSGQFWQKHQFDALVISFIDKLGTAVTFSTELQFPAKPNWWCMGLVDLGAEDLRDENRVIASFCALHFRISSVSLFRSGFSAYL